MKRPRETHSEIHENSESHANLDGHDPHQHDHNHGEGDANGQASHDIVRLSPEQLKAADIASQSLAPRVIATTLNAPGEVRLNAYATSKVTTRVRAQIVERHVLMGDSVARGQRLVTLSSVAMAEAQGELIVAHGEWQRVKALGRRVVSERRHTEARVASQQARARALAYGMTPNQVSALLKNGDVSRADGHFTLLSPQPGTVIDDDFIEGEMIEPGRVLFAITDESVLWVEARLTPLEASQVAVRDTARITINEKRLEGHVIQVHHTLDEATRTMAVRVEVPNTQHLLHPGLFVDVQILAQHDQPVLAVPEHSILHSPEGDWWVFVELAPGEYKPVPVNILQIEQGLCTISGLEAGSKVVTQGAFFLHSELAKEGFDIHQH